MSANAETQTPQQPANKKGKRKRALILLTLLFVIIAVAYGPTGFWFCVTSKKPMTLTWQGIRYKSWRRCPAA